MKKKLRTQILLEPGQHKALTILARQRETSMSEVVREAVSDYLTRRDKEAERREGEAALRRAREARAAIRRDLGGKAMDIDVPAMIREMREERVNQWIDRPEGEADDDRD